MGTPKEKLKEIQEKSVEILYDFDRFCQENNIQYSIAFGTALGAVRHSGFIPWDDDIDVQMHIDELSKFEKAWKKYGDKDKYFWQTKKTDPNLPNFFPRLRLNNTTSMNKEGLEIPLHWGLPLDVFLYYNVPRAAFMRKVIYKINKKANKLCGYSYHHTDSPNSKKYIKNKAASFLYSIIRISSKLCKQSNEVTYIHWAGKKQAYTPPAHLNGEDRIMFSGIQLCCSKKIKEYLEWQYGDYMTLPEEDKRTTHRTYIVDLKNDYSKYVDWKK